jgi:MFS family permease
MTAVSPQPAVFARFRARWLEYSPDARRHLINAALFGLTLDGGVNAVILNLYFLRLGQGPALVGLAGSVGMLVFALGSLPFGRLGDRVGLRRVMLLGAVIATLGALLVLFVDVLPDWLLPAGLIGCVALVNCGLAAYYANAAPYLAETAGAANRTRAFSEQSALYALAGFVGSLIGGSLPQAFAALLGRSLADPLPYRLTLIVVPCVLAYIAFALTRMREPGPQTDTDQPALASPTVVAPPKPERYLAPRAAFALIGVFSLMRFLQVGGVGAATTFFNVYMDRQFGVTPAVIGGFQAAAKLIGIPVALAIPWLTRRMGQVPLTLLASSLTVLSMLPMALGPAAWLAGLGYMGVWIVTPVRYAAFTVLSMERTPTRLRSTMNGAQEMAAGLSFSLMALSGGVLINTFGYTPLFLLGACLTVAGILALWIYAQRSSTS